MCSRRGGTLGECHWTVGSNVESANEGECSVSALARGSFVDWRRLPDGAFDRFGGACQGVPAKDVDMCTFDGCAHQVSRREQ